jgi:hypothetical protein
LGLLCAGFQYDPLPADNLVHNPWFQQDCEFSAEGWSVDQTADGLSWGGSDKTQNPSAESCGGEYNGNSMRWAKQSGASLEFSPEQDARFWQVVGPVDETQTVLRFHFLLVAHRMNQLRAQISGAMDADGPWTPLWTPLDKGWLNTGGANGPFDGTCDGGPLDRTCLWDKVTEDELGSLEPLSIRLDSGYRFYRIELLGNYPVPDQTATGDVGGKIARVYFALGESTSVGSGGNGGGSDASSSGSGGAGGTASPVEGSVMEDPGTATSASGCQIGRVAKHGSLAVWTLLAGLVLASRRRSARSGCRGALVRRCKTTRRLVS